MIDLNFIYTQEYLQTISNEILYKAKLLGATDARVEINEFISTDINILKQNIDNFETSYGTSLGLTVYIGHKKGNIALSSINMNNIDIVIKKALDIAKYTEDDMANGIPSVEFLCKNAHHSLDLDHSLNANNEQLITTVKDLEYNAIIQNAEIITSDGASVNLSRYNFIIANSNGFNMGYTTTRYSKSLSLIAKTNIGMQTDYWYSSVRKFEDLLSNDRLAQITIDRIMRRINKGTISSNTYDVIFESSIAKSMIASFCGAISGNNLYRKLSFLNDCLGQAIFPTWMNIIDDPFITKGLASCYFDSEGVEVRNRNLIKNGVVEGYILSNYTANKLNMQPTGNAGGTHNIIVNNNTDGNLTDLAHILNNGVIIIDTIGSGLNMVTGDYSVGASGLLVVNGEIQDFVDNFTISGNMRDIFQNICYINQDKQVSSMNCGDMLVKNIKINTN